MNAINHAATALLIKKRWPAAPLLPALVSVQLVEVLWVVLNITGIEKTTYEPSVHAINDIHLTYMPFSHSVASSLVIAALVWAVLKWGFGKASWAWPLAVGVLSHIVLDVATHVRDIEILPFLGWPEIGTGIYGIPLLALAVELGYSTLVWWWVRGSGFLLAALLLLNLAGLSVYVPQIAGPESLLPQHPQAFGYAILIHIVFGWAAVWWLYRKEARVAAVDVGQGAR